MPIAPRSAQYRRLRDEAQQVTIIRDEWGIPHVHGTTDAGAVFGAMYAQCEDDFSRVQHNLLMALGWTAQVQGEQAIWSDLREQLYIDPAALKRDFGKSPEWLQKLMSAWADGLNWYLAVHPDVHPAVIQHYEPWMALSFTEGSIGGDISQVNLAKLAGFYGAAPATAVALARAFTRPQPDESGSNGIAIAPRLSADRHALLLINPHTTFNFRTESQMSSDQGLDAYGASTWGQFFIYQGFNKHIGWMHTTSGADNVDQFAETIKKRDGKLFYLFGEQWLPIKIRRITIQYVAEDRSIKARVFTAYFTRHGPVVAKEDGRWITEGLMNRPIPALEQSWLRTKAIDLASFMKVADLKANSSNNTVFADDKGEIAFLMPQFIPRRNNRFNYLKPVDGSIPATAWQGLTPIKEMPNSINPPNGWVVNTNDWPYSVAGKYSPKRADYPKYMDLFGENARGVHAAEMLINAKDLTLSKLIAISFDSYLPAFARLIPILIQDYDAMPATSPLKVKLGGPIAVLRSWGYRWGITSIPTTLAVVWGDTLWDELEPKMQPGDTVLSQNRMWEVDSMAQNSTSSVRLEVLSQTIDRLNQYFGYWGVPWGEMNRYQRLDDLIVPRFDDAKPSWPVPFTESRWGSLASFSPDRWSGTKKLYGRSGNSFVAVVDFGARVSARAVHVGGQSGNPVSPHFTDQVPRYIVGDLRAVYFWPDQLKRHTLRKYHPGHN